tara:strand:- start:772 stop:1029 length:258 start_codon:yes stop_codon:yes gene_type:complete
MQLRLSFPERQLLLPLTDPVDQPSNIGEDLVDVVDLNADEFIVVHGTNCVTLVDPEPREGQFWDGDRWYNTDGLIAHDHDAEIDF